MRGARASAPRSTETGQGPAAAPPARRRPPPGSTWRLGGLSPRELAVRVGRVAEASDLGGRAAQLAFYFLFALFPLLIFLSSLFAFAVTDTAELERRFFELVGTLTPSYEVATLLQDTLTEVLTQATPGKLSLGLLAALWLASSGMVGAIRSLNASTGTRRLRVWWRRRLVATALTIAFALLTVLALALMFYGAHLGILIRRLLGIETAFWNLVRWSVTFLMLVASFDVIYNFAPAQHGYGRRWLTPGAVLATAVWIAASLGLREWVAYAGSYTRLYGSLAAVILLLAWLYVTALALLAGGAINAEICAAEGRCRRER